MNLFLFIQDDPFFLAREIPHLLSKHKFIGAIILSPNKPNENYFFTLKKYINLFGFKDFLLLAICAFTRKYLLQKNLANVISQNNIPLYKFKNINSIEFITAIKNLKIDLFISIACPQIFQKELLCHSKNGAINLHGGFLPDFPGVLTPFWNLYKGSKYGGCSVHWINARVDSGPIINKLRFPLENDSSIMSIYNKISKLGIPLLDKSLDQIYKNNHNYQENNYPDSNYNSFPTKKQIREFRKRQLRII